MPGRSLPGHPRPPAGTSARAGSALTRLLAAVVTLAVVGALAACQPMPRSAAGAVDRGPAAQVRLGYFPTVTHAPALVGLARGTFAGALGRTELTAQAFSAGPAAVEALDAGAIDVAFLGPNPAVTGFVMSEGEGLRVVSGVAAGGAQLVVRSGIARPEDLVGATLATPQLGGTQDVALRAWLADRGLESRLRGGGDVTVTPTANAQALQLFLDGTVDGVWAPEPWASRLVLEADGHVLVDERDLWPDGEFPTTYVAVRSLFLAEHPATVRDLLAGLLDTFDWMRAHPQEAADATNAALADLTGEPLAPPALERAFANVTFGPDPLAGSLTRLHEDAVSVGTTPDAPLTGILDLRLLNELRTARGEEPLPDAGLGQDRPGEPGGDG